MYKHKISTTGNEAFIYQLASPDEQLILRDIFFSNRKLTSMLVDLRLENLQLTQFSIGHLL